MRQGVQKGCNLGKYPGKPGESFKEQVTGSGDIPGTVGDGDLFVWVRETPAPSCWCVCPYLSLSFPTCRVVAVNTPQWRGSGRREGLILEQSGGPGLPSAGAGAQPGESRGFWSKWELTEDSERERGSAAHPWATRSRPRTPACPGLGTTPRALPAI